MQSSYRRSQSLAARAVPALLTLLVSLMTAVPSHLMGNGDLAPAFTLICIFYWAVYLPGALPYSFLFILGLLQDSLSGMPLGISSFINMSMAFLLTSQRRLMGKTLFGTVWLTCAMLSALAFMAQWGAMCLYYSKPYDLGAPFLRWAVTCIAYPPSHLLLTQVYKRIKER